MKKAMWISYSSDEHEPNFPFNINDVINVEEDFEAGWANGLWEILDDEGFSISYEYSGELLNQCYLYKPNCQPCTELGLRWYIRLGLLHS